MLEALDGRMRIASGELTVENTTFCGAKCVMCPRDEFARERHWQHMTFDTFKNVIDQAVPLGMQSLDLCGFGDPLMDPNLRQKLEYVSATYPGVSVYTSTTAHLLYEKNLDWICKNFDTLKISNYGFSKESYEKVHAGVVKFDKVWENVHRLLSIPREKRPYVIMSFLVFPENEHEIEGWKAYWAPRADEIMVWLPHNYGGSDTIEEVAYMTSARAKGSEARSCGRPFKGNPFVRANGDVSVCCYDFNHKLVVGNLNKTSLLNILGGEQLAHVQSVHNGRNFEGCGLLCDGCDQIFDRKEALMFASNKSRNVNQPTTHPEHIVKLVDEAASF